MLKLGKEVKEAIDAGAPVVALESTLITHGLSYPFNLEIARELEQIVRDAGVVPATVAIVGGDAWVGLSGEHLEQLVHARDARKISRRNLAIAVGRGVNGGTTVAATMHLAKRAGIQVMATGGIGGVHRGHPFDVSADLPELAQTSMIVACSGAKSLLNLPLTREWLETWGVTVLGWETEELPAFYSRTSGLSVDARVNDAGQVAAIWRNRAALEISGGMLVAVPIPAEDAYAASQIEGVIAKVLEEAERRGVQGNELTPFALREIAERTNGESLRANLSLLRNNARVASEIAKALSENA